MFRTLEVRSDRFPLAKPFRISRGVKTVAEVITVTVRQDGAIGRGEGVPYPRYHESIDSSIAEIETVRDALQQGASRQEVQSLLGPGAARNAVDCALWDLEATLSGRSVPDMVGIAPADPMVTAMTVGLDAPDRMREAARALAHVPLLKIKVDRSDPERQIRSVRDAAPDPRIIVDPNESWSMAEVERLQPVLAELRIDLLEQPLPAEADEALSGFSPLVPIAADESAHVAGDIAALAAKYQVVNVKLDKTGGLTAALALADAVRGAGMGLMTGCMICSSLSIAPALLVAARAEFVDLDGPFWLAEDRAGGVGGGEGRMTPPHPRFWGGV